MVPAGQGREDGVSYHVGDRAFVRDLDIVECEWMTDILSPGIPQQNSNNLMPRRPSHEWVREEVTVVYIYRDTFAKTDGDRHYKH